MSKKEIINFIKTFKLDKHLDKNNVEYRETGTDQYVLNRCPFCNNVNYKGNIHENRLYISSENGKFICYNCGQKGSLFRFLAKLDNISIKGAFDKYLSNDYFEALPEVLQAVFLDDEKESEVEEPPLPELTMPSEFESLLPLNNKYKEAYEYMNSRDFCSKKIIKQFDLRYCRYKKIQHSNGKEVSLYRRLIFPVYFEGRLVGYQGRDIAGLSVMKYYLSEGFKKSKIIYNYDNVKDAESIVITEGIVDLFKCINNNPICLFGKTLSKEQLILLHKMKNLKRIIVALDPDTKIADKIGNIPYMDLVNILKNFWKVYEIDIPQGKDPGDYSIEEMDEIIKNATIYNDNKIIFEL